MRSLILYTVPALIVGISVYALPNPTPEELIERENRQAIMDCLDTLSGSSLEIQKGTLECSKIPFRSITGTHSTGSSVLPPKGLDTLSSGSSLVGKSKILVQGKQEQADFWKTYDIAIPLIRKYEGLQLKAYWDYNGYSIGYGTRAKHASEVIAQKEADARLGYIVKQVVARVQADFPTLSSEQQAGLVSFAYNCEAGYRSVRDNGLEFHKQWCRTAGGKVLQGLLDRRNEEAGLIFK